MGGWSLNFFGILQIQGEGLKFGVLFKGKRTMKNHLVWRRSAKAVAFSGPGPFYFFSAERVLISGLLMIWRLSRFRKSSFAGLHFFLQNGVFLSKTDIVASTLEEMGETQCK